MTKGWPGSSTNDDVRFSINHRSHNGRDRSEKLNDVARESDFGVDAVGVVGVDLPDALPDCPPPTPDAHTHAHRDAQRDSGAHVYNTMLLGTSRTSPGAVTARGDGRQTSSHHKTQKGAMPPMTPSTPPHCPALAAARSAAPA